MRHSNGSNRGATKLIAGSMAAVMTFGFGGGGSLVSLTGTVAYAQTSKKPAPAPASKKGAAPAKTPDAKADPKADASKNDDLKKARDSYASGETKFKAGDYAGALADFMTADSIKPSPQAARYIGLCEDNLGKLPDAVTAYERFLANVPSKLQKEGDEIKKRVELIKAMPGKVHVVSTPPGAQISVDGKASTQVSPAEVEVTPGKHAFHIAADGRIPQDQDVDVTYGAKQDLTVDLAPQPEVAAPPPPVAVAPPPDSALAPPPPVEARSKVPAYITGGLAIAAAGVGTAFGIMALGTKSDFDKNPTTDRADDGENQALIADMAFGVALTLGVTSLVLFLTGDDTSATKSTAADGSKSLAKPSSVSFSFAPIVAPKTGGAGAVLHF